MFFISYCFSASDVLALTHTQAQIIKPQKEVSHFLKLIAQKVNLIQLQEDDSKTHRKIKQLQKEIVNALVCMSLVMTTLAAIFVGMHFEKCPTGFDSYLPYRGQCYLAQSTANDWSYAHSFCKDQGGFILEPYTQTEIEYLEKLLNLTESHIIWLGASDQMNLKLFKWNHTNREATYDVPWAKHFPAERGTRTSCIALLAVDKQWINAECYEKIPFFCKALIVPNSTHLRWKL